jgi:hypothetical protein
MKFPVFSCLILIHTPYCLTVVSSVSVEEKLAIQVNPNLRPRRNKECPDGFGGTSCNVNVDECKGLPYPCAGGTKHGSFCVDYDPPEKFKCGCQAGYDAVLPDAMQVKDPVPVEWRPLKCLPKDVCVDFVCHEDATCIVSSTNTAVCVCNDNLIGDGIINCSQAPKTVAPKLSRQQSRTCQLDSDCVKLENSVCVEGICKCKAGFFESNGKGQCVNENECADGFPNDCHKYADCIDKEGSYTCACKDGYQDLSPEDQPGRVCGQINECLFPSLHDCDNETQVCLDLPPPMKWQCVDRTPAPTPAPTCNDVSFTFTYRITVLAVTPPLIFDNLNLRCIDFELYFDGVCNCQGAQVSTDGSMSFEIISNNPRGTRLADFCCYCRDRRDTVCQLGNR